MAHDIQLLDYEIHLSDQAEVEARTSTTLDTGISRMNFPVNSLAGTLGRPQFTGEGPERKHLYCCPDRAVLEYPGTIIVNTSQPKPANPPYITSPNILGVGTRDRYPTDQDQFERKSGGWFGISALFGDTHKYIWRGSYVYTPSTTPVDGPNTPSAPDTIRQRRWADGFEWPAHGEGSSAGEAALANFVTRDASRHPDGLGLRIADPMNATKAHRNDEFRPAFAPTTSWERLYIRIWDRPTADFQFWHAQSSAGALNAIELSVLPSGQIAIYDVSNAGVRSIQGTTAQVFELGRWYRLDILLKTGTVAVPSSGYIKLYIGRVLSLDVTVGLGGWGAVGTHVSSNVGNGVGATLGICMDIDDWICADLPQTLANNLALDWLNGSRVVKLTPDSYGPSHSAAAWGANKSAIQLGGTPSLDNSANDHDSTTAGSVLEVDLTLEALYRVGADKNAINGGIVALTAGLHNQKNVGGGDGTLSISRNGGAYVDTAIAQANTLSFDNAAYLPSGLAQPEPLTELKLKYTAGSGIQDKIVRGFQATVELLGIFETSDLVVTSAGGTNLPPAAFPSVGPHNAPYERSQFAYNTGTAPISPVVIHSKTYVGTGAPLELKFRAPVSFAHIRRVTAAISMGSVWWSSMMSGSRGVSLGSRPDRLLRARYDMIVPAPPPGEDQQEAECTIRIAGNDAAANSPGVTYEIVTFQDPGMRFSTNQTVHHPRGTADRATALFKPTFLARFGMFWRRTAGGGTNVGFYAKGPGHAADDVNRFDNVVLNSALNFTAGFVNTKSAFVPVAGASGDEELPFSLWRSDDTSGDPGIPDTIQIGTWTGDGNARTINFAGTTKRPLFAIVVSHNGTSVFRDPQHTGTTSSQYATGDTLTARAADGITGGGPGSMSVGTGLSSNGVVYEYLVFMGGDTAGNNGWSADGEFVPVEPWAPTDWPGGDTDPPFDVDNPGPDDGGGGGGGTGDGPTGDDPPGEDFGTQCVDASTRVCNQALSAIGITKRITDIVNGTDVEDEQARLHYADAVNEALREFPWAFATKYATLTLLDGVDRDDPVNEDWIFAYAVPSDLIYARRILNVEEDKHRGFDPAPPQFRMGTATINGTNTHVIFCDTEDAQLEYTYRPSCAATRGDALFRDALKWLVASKLAPGLARNKMTAETCFKFFLEQVSRAKVQSMREQQPNPDASGDAPWLRERQ